MATPTPPQGPSQEQLRRAQYNTLITYTSITALLLCPLLIALPPRKFDFYTVLLISGTAVGGNQVLREYTGRGIADRIPTLERLVGDGDADAEARERIKAMEERLRRGDFGTGAGRKGDGGLGTTEAVARAVRDMRGAERVGGRGTAAAGVEDGEAARHRKADWKVQRDAREKEALEDGRGYGGLIIDQIWEVWNWGGGTGGDGGEKGMEGKGEEERKRK